MKASTKIKWNDLPANVPTKDVTLVMEKACEAFHALGKQASLIKQDLEHGRLEVAKKRLSLIEEYSDLYIKEINL